MIFECANGMFGGVPAVHLGRGELKIDVLLIHKSLQSTRGFVVESLEERFETLGFEKVDRCFVGGNDGLAGAVGHRCTIDVVAVALVYDEYILVPGDDGREELACRIGVDHAGGALTVCIDGTRANGGGLRRRGVVIGNWVDGWERRSRLSRAGVHVNLVEVTLVHGHGMWWIFSNGGRCEAGPCGKMSSVDSGAPCGEGWREEARVVEIDTSGNGIVG
jgi:hypothetical protein